MNFKTKKNLIVVTIVLSLISVCSSVSSHSPSSITLQYEFSTNALDVTIYHSVSDTSTHYINEITIWVNDILNQTRNYSVQDSTSQQQDTFTVLAVHGDEIEVQADCVLGGSVVESVIVDNPAIPELGVATSWIFSTLFASLIGYLISKKKKKRNS